MAPYWVKQFSTELSSPMTLICNIFLLKVTFVIGLLRMRVFPIQSFEFKYGDGVCGNLVWTFCCIFSPLCAKLHELLYIQMQGLLRITYDLKGLSHKMDIFKITKIKWLLSVCALTVFFIFWKDSLFSNFSRLFYTNTEDFFFKNTFHNSLWKKYHNFICWRQLFSGEFLGAWAAF
jgi:hypothetical protein